MSQEGRDFKLWVANDTFRQRVVHLFVHLNVLLRLSCKFRAVNSDFELQSKTLFLYLPITTLQRVFS